MHNSAPARGTDAWYTWVEQMLAKHDPDIKRLWDRIPQSPDNLGDAAQNPDYDPPSS